ncbi:hypothetical protein HELRODRAFT_159176 [Helobdella robusta]|uniref:Uncharacterized protein n=1 Tax=Helobdella robusta TaxID=6412 RepID=T1ENP7_HELRO|nr:hypothetical protein HELRODRAFT_159176 [Helobdella robusta]ESO12609.1 hypothetical protein HELRODRAFT_159176 [Helobdella robusta]
MQRMHCMGSLVFTCLCVVYVSDISDFNQRTGLDGILGESNENRKWMKIKVELDDLGQYSGVLVDILIFNNLVVCDQLGPLGKSQTMAMPVVGKLLLNAVP